METSKPDAEQAESAELASSSTSPVPIPSTSTGKSVQPSGSSTVPSLTINTKPVELDTTLGTPYSSTDSANTATTALDIDNDKSFDRRNSTNSAITSETLLNSPLLPTSPTASFWKGKQKEIQSPTDLPSEDRKGSSAQSNDGGLLSPVAAEKRHASVRNKPRRHRHRHLGYGTVDPLEWEGAELVLPCRTARARAVALVNEQREYRRLADELRMLQEAWGVDEESQLHIYHGYGQHYRRLFYGAPPLLCDGEYDPERRITSCWPSEVNRTNVSIVWALYAMAMLYLCIYGPRVVTSIFATT